MIYWRDRRQQSHVGTCSPGIKIEGKDRDSGAFQVVFGGLGLYFKLLGELEILNVVFKQKKKTIKIWSSSMAILQVILKTLGGL